MKIKVRSVPDKFRRAGITFTKTPGEYDVDAKTLKVLQAESMLVVEVLPEEKKDPEKGKAQDKEKAAPGQDESGKKDKGK